MIIFCLAARPSDLLFLLESDFINLRKYKRIGLCIGGNCLSKFRNRPRMSPEEVATTISWIEAPLSALGIQVMICGVTPRGVPRTTGLYEDVGRLNSILYNIYGKKFIGVSALHMGHISDIDFVHFNKKGSQAFVANVIRALVHRS